MDLFRPPGMPSSRIAKKLDIKISITPFDAHALYFYLFYSCRIRDTCVGGNIDIDCAVFETSYIVDLVNIGKLSGYKSIVWKIPCSLKINFFIFRIFKIKILQN